MSFSEEIGGYFELEINKGSCYHKKLIPINTGRNSLEYILRVRKYKHLFIPYYTCDVLTEPLKKLGVKYDFYSINQKLEPVTEVNVNKESGFLYTDYFGLKKKFIGDLSRKQENLIIDSCQSFFSFPESGIDTFYSPRKFFGISDGGYVSINQELDEPLGLDISNKRFFHLLSRVEYGAESGYNEFKANELSLSNQKMMQMSLLTRKILSGINYKKCLKKRNENFQELHTILGVSNQFKWIDISDLNGPMAYPYYSEDQTLRTKLLESKIFVPQFWPNVLEWVGTESIEYRLAKNLLPLPIDHRYGKPEMKKIATIIHG